MAEQEWKGPLFDPPQVRREAQQPIKIEQPDAMEVRQVVAPPMPGQNDPQLAAAVWQQPDAPEPPPDPAQTVAGLSLALYLLQTLHTQDKPGYEHLVRQRDRDEDDADER